MSMGDCFMNTIEELGIEQSKNDINSKIFYKISFSIKESRDEMDLLWELVLHIKRWLDSKERKKGIIHVPREMRYWTHFKNGNKLYDAKRKKTFYAESIYRVNPENDKDISWACRIRECQNESGFAPRCGNAEGFFSMLTEDWCKFHAITFCGGNINALYTPDIAIDQPDVSELLKYDGARTIKMRPWSAYTQKTQFQIENEKVTLTVSIGQTAETNNVENRGAYNLGKMYTFFRFSFENAQGFEKIEKYYIIARKIVAILTSQNNIFFEEVYLSQRNSEQKYFKTGICKIFDSYENYSIRQWHKVIPIFSVFDYIPNLIDGIVNGKANSLLELLPEDNKMVNRISIKNVQDLCTALEVSYHLDDRRKREKDTLIEELKKNIKNTIAEFTKVHNEIDVNKETTMSSAFQYLDYTLKQKIFTLYNENSDVVDAIVSKYSLPSVNENSIASFVKLRNNKTHSGTVEWGESAKIYAPLFAIVYASFFKYIKLPDEVIKSTLLQIF